jgi:hypothetical protein
LSLLLLLLLGPCQLLRAMPALLLLLLGVDRDVLHPWRRWLPPTLQPLALSLHGMFLLLLLPTLLPLLPVSTISIDGISSSSVCWCLGCPGAWLLLL